MNKLKGSLCLLCAAAMVFTLAACGGDKDTDPTPAADNTTPVEESVAPTPGASVDTPAPTPEATPETPVETPMPTPEATPEAPVATPAPTLEPTPEPEPEKPEEPEVTSAPPPELLPESAGIYVPGTYTGTGDGFGGGIVTATVTVDENSILNVTLDGSTQTPEIGGVAIPTLEANAMAQGADMDGVTDATLTSDGARQAVANALENAKRS